MLYVIATPIGNLEDLTFRAVRTLTEVDIILTEDTRRASKLLQHYKIKNRMSSYHEFTNARKEDEIIRQLLEGKEIALISDAGTPLISDPGFTLVKKARESGIKVIPIPGASAPIAALSASGLASDSFAFFGFFPKRNSEKNRLLDKIKTIEITSIFYESPYRIKKTMKLLYERLPDHRVCIAREMTKKFEEFILGTPSDILDETEDREIKGEITVIVEKKMKK